MFYRLIPPYVVLAQKALNATAEHLDCRKNIVTIPP